ncbi:MAG TPA: 23S rRNA (adenine(2030)-N(6))-methyltransferase RlmJ [Hyphomicrobiales bacterium]|nr:23S rRNA (adenine(2030)-N(6))-methyltransferase RlmJ [Hyphomicrobiales bacterium]
MNYRHAYHAGNHGDVLKHIVMTRVLAHLAKKDKPFRVIDAYAGTGLYALDGVEAGKTREWEGGIGKLAEPFAPEIEALLTPFRQIIAALNPEGGTRLYPGSPEIALRMMRPRDALIANELHPEDSDLLASNYAHDPRVTVTQLDAAASVKGNCPPPERRGLVLLDPPYEQLGEAEKAAKMLEAGLRRFSTGIFMLWYPVKAKGEEDLLAEAARTLGVAGTLKVEMRVREPFRQGGLAGSGLIIVNTPWKLNEELSLILPALGSRLGIGEWGRGEVEWLVPSR